jgi:hypothetical protein
MNDEGRGEGRGERQDWRLEINIVETARHAANTLYD